MEIRVEFDSALASSRSYVEVLLPPFPPGEDVRTPVLRSWEEQWEEQEVTRTREASVESRYQAEEFALTEEQAIAISDAVRAVRIVPTTGSFKMFSVCDGWNTKLTLDAYDSRVVLSWFLHPPPEWIAVRELCDAIERMASSLKLERG